MRWIAAVLVLMAGVVADTGQAVAQSGDGNRFIPLGRIPQLLQPGGQTPPRFRRGARPIKFFVDEASLPQSLSRNLSNACAHGRFNAKRAGRYFVEIQTQRGGVRRFGFANSEGFNLRDPDNLRGRDFAFLFELDGTSQCRVYALPTVF